MLSWRVLRPYAGLHLRVGLYAGWELDGDPYIQGGNMTVTLWTDDVTQRSRKLTLNSLLDDILAGPSRYPFDKIVDPDIEMLLLEERAFDFFCDKLYIVPAHKEIDKFITAWLEGERQAFEEIFGN